MLNEQFFVKQILKKSHLKYSVFILFFTSFCVFPAFTYLSLMKNYVSIDIVGMNSGWE